MMEKIELEKSEIIKRKIEEHKIEQYEDDVRPISYTYNKRIAQEKAHEVRIEKARKLFFKYLDFYNENYPKSTKDIEWPDKRYSLNIDEKMDFEEILNDLSEDDLHGAHKILFYSKKESFSGSMKEHEDYLQTDAMITKRIPGWNILDKIEKIKERQLRDIREIKQLEKLFERERKAFLSKKEERIEKKEDIKEFLCELCGKDCTNKAGLTSHMRGHKNGNENEVSYKVGSLEIQ